MQLIVHTDGGSRGNPGQAAIGVTIEDENGNSVWEAGESIGITTNNVAEHSAVRRALEYIVSEGLHPDKVLFLLDSLLVAQQLSRRYKINKPELSVLAHQSWGFIEQLSCPVQFTHVLREKNKEADALVNRALDSL